MPSSANLGPTLACIAPFGFTFDIRRFLRAYAQAGCTTCQFYRNEQNPPTVREALAAAADAGLRFDSIHGVFGYHLDPSSPDAGHRAHCLKVYEDEGKLAKDLGGPLVVVHPAKWNENRLEMSRPEVEASSRERWPHLADFLSRLAETGERLGVTYLIENQPLNCPLGHDAAALAAAVRSIGSPAIAMCLDSGHAHITGDAAEAVRACADVIGYLHIHDNDGRLDDHRMPGDGTLDWGAFAAALRETGLGAVRMLEVFYDEAKVEGLNAGGLRARLAAQCAIG